MAILTLITGLVSHLLSIVPVAGLGGLGLGGLGL